MFESSKQVWLDGLCEKNSYVDFYEIFYAEEDRDYILYISASSDYAVYINGRYVESGQYADYSFWRVYDTLYISNFLKKGKNDIVITVYWQGEDSSRCRKEPPGVIYEIHSEKPLLFSGEKTLARKNENYISSPCPHISSQLGYTINYDSRNISGPYKPVSVYEIDTSVFHPRPVKKLVLSENVRGKIITQGIFRVLRQDEENFAREIMYSFNSFTDGYKMREPHNYIQYFPCPGFVSFSTDEDCDGIYFIMDYGEENTGFFSIDIELEEDALILVGFGEHTEDMRIRSCLPANNYALRYYAKKGRNTFMCPFRRIGLRYMEFHIYTKRFCLYYAGFRSTLYPVSFDALFDCGDFLHNKIFEVCKRTLLLCMHEHYEDCPMREQAQYTMDSRNQMLAGYWVFREHEFAKASIRLMALSIRDDNMLELCSPARVSITIPSFSAIFLTIAAEYLEYTGDLDFILEILPVLESLAGKFISCKEANGLIRCFKEGIYWNFYEWQDGLSGVIGRDTPEDERTYDAPLCAFVSLGFRSLAKIYSKFDSENEKKYTCLHLSMNKSINDIFWDEKQKAYASFMHNGNLSHFCELTQSLILYIGAAEDSRCSYVLEKIKNKELLPVTPSHAVFKYEALLRYPGNRKFVFDDIAKIWGKMLFNNATTFWETEDGAAAFGNAGSLCHGWSATPAYIYMKYGVEN